jgi:hypothetical protein
MGNSGIGIGSSSIVLVFAVLCLTIFSMISLTIATSERTLTDAEVEMVVNYYLADALAEEILAYIRIAGNAVPQTIQGISIQQEREEDILFLSFINPITELKGLYVRIALRNNVYDILQWRMIDLLDWVPDTSIVVWEPWGD